MLAGAEHRRAFALPLCAPLLTFAAQTDADEEAFELSVRNFGYTAGAAHQCAKETERRKIEAEAIKAYSGLTRLFGTDQAFFFAAAFGAGSTMPVDTSKCAEYTANFNTAMRKHKAQ
jgi:hypothetical protein